MYGRVLHFSGHTPFSFYRIFQVEDDSEDHDYKQDSQFKTHLKKSEAQSDFSKRLTIQEQRRFLPVYDVREDLLNVIRDNQVGRNNHKVLFIVILELF